MADCSKCSHLKDHWECDKYGETYATVREWHNYWECPGFEEQCRDMLWDFKENHDWYHIIGVSNSDSDHSFAIYKCRRCGAILLRKWGKEIIIKDKSSSTIGNNVVAEVIAGGLEFNETWGEWEEPSH